MEIDCAECGCRVDRGVIKVCSVQHLDCCCHHLPLRVAFDDLS
jgi:hypothetical protein